MKWKSFFKRIMIFVLALTIINSTITSSVALSTMSLLKLYDSEVETNTSVDETNQTEENTNKNTLQTQPGGGTVFQDDAINIYNIAQLKAIGTNKIVYTNDNDATTFGTGSIVVDDDNNVVTYSSSANYRLMNDIPLDINDLWQLPEDFTGKFVSEDITENPVYDKTSDTIYVYHSYQLQTIASNTSNEEPVMSKDANPELYGMGQLTYIDDNNYVTYSKEHNYVLSKLFTGTRPSMISAVYANNNVKSDDQKAGRDYVGQIIKEIDGIEYILIGSKEQLFAIGKKEYGSLLTEKRYAQVTGPAYSYENRTGQFTLEYCGDADLELNSNSNENNNGKIIDDGADNGLSPVKWYGVDENGRPSLDCKGKQTTGKYYAPDENYIIFRDIDLENKEWTPLMFSGTMEGRLNMVSGANPEIKNVKIVQNGKLPIDEYIGIGFFGTISNKVDSTTSVSKGTAKVSNITLNHVSVENYSTDVKKDFSLIGVVLSPIINKISSGLKEDISTFATGGFAGRIQGDAIVANCEVKNLDKLTNEASVTGGFAGNIEGTARYEIITSGLGDLLTNVSRLLNIIPILGLGDLITILLNGGLLDVGNLLPIGYYTPTVKNCRVSGINTTEIGNINTNFHGAFSGKQEGSIVQDCKVKSTNSLTVNAKNYAGGFSGVIANGEISGTLESLGIDIADFTLQSVNANSELSLPDIVVNAQENYAGGFTGSLFSSYAIDCTINLVDEKNSQNEKINAKNYAGGFAGRSTIGWGITVGKEFDSKYDDNLLTKVKGLLNIILQGNNEGDILSLVGIYPSEAYGVQIEADNLQIDAKENYAGGLIGQSDALKINNSKQQFLEKLRPFEKKLVANYAAKDRETLINGLQSVNSESNYAGGLIGQVKPISAAGLLNSTIGISNYFGFDINDVVVNGKTSGFNISAKNYAGGAIGQGIGGDVENVRLEGINTISAKNYAGGFVASAGTGSLVGAGGLDILGLGLIEIKDLLSLAKAVSFNANNCTVNGISDGFTVKTTGDSTTTSGDLSYYAGGFVGENSSANLTNCSVKNLKYVSSDKQNGRAGGFAAEMSTGGLAGIAEDSNEINLPGILNVEGLVSAVKYLIPKYQNCNVAFVSNGDSPQVEGAIAGGFIGNMGAGTVDNSGLGDSHTVSGLDNVLGTYYAGGFAGKATAGGFVNSGNGIKLLGLIKLANITDLISVLNVYIPKIVNANVTSNIGLMVKAEDTALTDTNSGSAGGFIGYGSGVQISNSNVEKLRYIDNSSLLGKNPSSEVYYNEDLKYAVEAKKNAGGYAGKLDIGNAASVGNGISLLGNAVTLANLTEVLDVVASKVQNSSVKGDIGGYAIRANGSQNSAIIGNAGGFVGAMYGSALQNADADNFEYIIGQETAGGYAGRIEPGNVANVVSNTDVLGGLISANSLLSVVSAYIPMIYNSQASCVPCGGYVIANGKSDKDTLRGVAGGYVGYNLGGRIEGESNREWKDIVNGTKVTPSENSTFELKENSIIRLRLVEGYEFAGGFTGKLETANVADTGNLNVLYGLIELSNPIQALGAVYPTETNTATYGPLKKLDTTTWNSWYNAIGKDGAYGNWMKEVSSKEELQTLIDQYAYGYDVIATRNTTAAMPTQGGVAGGYVGRMDGGVITNADANDLKNATAYRSTGGFVGEMITAGVANVSGIEIANIDVLGDLGGLLNVFVPVINGSSISGYKSGMIIKANGIDRINNEGNAGGFVGSMIGGQINIEGTTNCEVNNIKLVRGSYGIGGFAGSILPGSAAKVNSASNQGLLNIILKPLIGSVDDLAKLLNATVATVKHVTVNSNTAAGYVVDGKYGDNQYAYAAGGFAGNVNGAVIGELKNETTNNSYDITVNNVQSVIGGEHVGGFLGLGDVAAVAQVSNEDDINILRLIKLGAIDVLDAFRTYVYNSLVKGGKNGLKISANTEKQIGILDENADNKVFTGNAGGFAGSLLNGSIKESTVDELNSVKALNYAGGFIGHMGKSGTVDIDKVETIGGLLNGALGVLDIFGSHTDNCTVNGQKEGFTVTSKGGQDAIAGGFTGNGDLARIDSCNVTKLNRVSSDLTAGGFIGKTNYAYLAEIGIGSSSLLNPVLSVVNTLLDYLYVGNLEEIGLITIKLPGELEKILNVEVLNDGNALSVTLLGIPITVALVKNNGDGTSDVAQIHIGDSYIEVPCTNTKGNHIKEEDMENIKVGLIKANRTKVVNSTVDGIETGYDVFGSGATKDKLGNNENGYTGGFVGYNNEGLFENNTMLRADKIKGAPDNVNGFSGRSALESVYDFNTMYGIEGHNNIYHVYRVYDNDKLNYLCRDVKDVVTTNGELLGDKQVLLATFTPPQDGSVPKYYDYQINHLNSYVYNNDTPIAVKHLDKGSDWQEAYQTTAKGLVKFNANVYVTNGELDLMDGSINDDIVQDPVKDEGAMQDPCSDEINLKIQKLWVDDNNKDNARPEQVTIKLNRYILDESGEKVYDNTFTNVEKTINLSNVDYDTNSWSYTIPAGELPLKDSNGNKYYYEVTENPVDGYLTIYDQSEDGYTFYITNYRTTSIMDGDSVVIDYGLPVVVDVMENDRIANDSELQGTLTGVTKINRDGETDGVNSEVYSQDAVTSKLWTDNEEDAASCIGNYGEAEILDTNSDNKNESIKYTPTNMNMDNFEKLLYAVNVDIKDDANTESNTKPKIADGQNYVYSTLDIIPATQIYYEDNFTTVINYNSGEDKNGNEIDWKVEGTTDENRTQDVNRPGMRQITKALDNGTEKTYDVNYGFDTSYINDNTFGDGSAHYVVVDKNTKKTNFPSLEFTFTGTGFDVISLTNNQTGTIIARVYKVDENGDVAENAKPIRSWVVDTYYGYRFDIENKEWVIDNTVDTPLYQVPIIRSDDNSKGPLDYGTYKVTITLTYSSIIDNTDDNKIPNGYKYYFDGVRIYGSANKNNSDYQVIEDAYIADHENNPEYLEIRDLLIKRGDADISDVPEEGFGFIDGSISEVTLSDYINYGPKHETYLKPGQAISFYLESDYKPDAVHIGAKVASGSNLNLGLYLMNRENDIWVPYKERTDIVLNSTGELFRDLSNQCVWEEVEVDGQTKYQTRYPIVICNNEQPSVQDENNGFQDIISLTQIKLTGKPTNTTTEELGFRVYSNYDSVEAAYSVVRSQFEKKITVKYVDLNGNSITQDEIKKVEVNKTYDVSDLVNKEINGYSIVEVKGDVTGTADSDKEVTVVYGKNYQLKVNYVDLQGNQLEEAYVEKTVEGNTYDLTEASKQEIDGYSIVEVKGDVTGTADSNKEVTVVYGKNYQLKVNYVDLQGNQLEEAYVEKTVEGNTYDLTEASKQEISGYSIVEVKGDVTGTADSNKEVTVVYGKNYQLIVQYLDENGNKLAKDYTVTGIEGNRYDLSLQVNVKINGYEFDKVIGDLITGIIDQDKVVKVLYIKETNSDMTNNDSNKPNQDHTMDNNNITSLKTGDDINITFALIGLCLSILMGWVFIRKSKKFKDE
ncbi:MucBP domain-containing protein [Thomasclavelia spiroformis]|nr:MucBP domain-containing protein [Thomasclavelia spiroformis]